MAITGYQGYNQVDFERAAQTTLADHITDVEKAFTRNFPALAQLESMGRIMYNQEGRGFDWKVRYRIHTVEGNTGETQRNFVRRNLYKTPYLEYRGYQATDAMYNREFLENRGRAGVIKVFDGMIERIDESLQQVLGKEVYTDGNATGNEQLWHGFESMFSQDGTVDTSQTSGFAARTANQGDYVGYPDDTYAGLSTTLGNYGGDWTSGVWPLGDGDPEVDFYSPMIVMTDSTRWTSGSELSEAFRFGIIHCQKNSTLDEQMTTGVLSRELYMSFENELDDKEEITVTSDHSLRALGFRNVISFDGIEFTFDSAISPNVGYGYNYNKCDVRCLYPTLLHPEGPEYDIHTQAYNAVVSTLSNFRFKSPRNFIKWMPFASFTA